MPAYVRIFTDDAGESHFDDIQISLTATDFAPPAPPLDVSAPFDTQRLVFVGAPSDWYGDWHPSPARQFVFMLGGTFEVKVSDGEVRSFSTGDTVLLEDTTGKGHCTRVASAEAGLMAMCQLGP